MIVYNRSNRGCILQYCPSCLRMKHLKEFLIKTFLLLIYSCEDNVDITEEVYEAEIVKYNITVNQLCSTDRIECVKHTANVDESVDMLDNTE